VRIRSLKNGIIFDTKFVERQRIVALEGVFIWILLYFDTTLTYNSQSTATISETSLTGSPTAVNTINMVTNPADGTDAAPIEARVAVKLNIG